MTDLILFIGLIALWAMHRRLATRFEALEREVEQLRDGAAGPAPPSAEPWRGAEQSEEAAPAPALRRAAPMSAEALGPPLPEADEPAPRESAGAMFERLVGGGLLIWIGGIALALAGLFLVRYSIQIGLVTPVIRMAMAAVFGLILVAAGEVARSRPGGLLDPRTAQALVGAGILVLYATAYGAHILYGLIGLETASALMVAVTVAALALALRHGAPAAAMGLVGGFATPLLVGNPSDSSVPLLTYLALLNLALFALAGRRGWTWLAASATLLSFGWSGVLLMMPAGHAAPAGVFILVLAVAASLVRAGGGWQLDFIRPAAIGLVELAILVARVDIGHFAWLLYAALSAACFFLATRRTEYRILPALALVLALLLLALNAPPWLGEARLREIAAGITLLFAAGALPGALRGRRLLPAFVACAAFAGPVSILRMARPDLFERPLWGALFAAAALGPLLVAWSRRRLRDGKPDEALAAAAATALTLLGAASWHLLPEALVGGAWFALALGAAYAAHRLADRRLAFVGLAGAAAATLWAAAMLPALWATLGASLAGDPALATRLPPVGRSLTVLALPVPLLAAIWHFLPKESRFRPLPLAGAASFAAAALYVLFKEILHLSDASDFVVRGFAERTLLNQLLFLAGWLVCTGRLPIPGLDGDRRWLAGVSLTALAAARLVWFDMLIHNPAFTPQEVGRLPVLNLLLPAFLLSAFWLYKARRGAEHQARSGVWLALFLAALMLGVMLSVRQIFQGSILSHWGVPEAESYGYSLAGLLLSIALLLSGIRLADKALRLAGLAFLTATIIKVFGFDAAALEGVLRILSFLGLGVALIGIGRLYGTVLRAEAAPRAPAAPAG